MNSIVCEGALGNAFSALLTDSWNYCIIIIILKPKVRRIILLRHFYVSEQPPQSNFALSSSKRHHGSLSMLRRLWLFVRASTAGCVSS